jgi:hypothetical protein
MEEGPLNSEIGRELLAHELVVKTVVVVGRDDRPYAASMWVREIGSDAVVFYSGISGTYLMLRRNPDETMQDDTGTRIRAFEYRGAL